MSDSDFVDIEPMSIDQLAGSFVLIMGAIGSLLLVVWQSRCECDLNLCYIIRCHRKPPPDEKIKKKDKDGNDLKDPEKEEEEKIIPPNQPQPEPEPEIEP
tara:strand:+ start:127 stop:426 length:300 start_codon:yes stop_codon:yes gene_type:complete